MLKISEMELCGFKSFPKKTNLAFTGAVTAVVGPNGCGKSNIADALSWVLGEQSAKLLRGTKMEDLIFSGTSNRKALGMAEVTLKLMVPGEGDKAGSNRPLLVTRRLFRDGESEYRIDGKRCRLLDIQDRLLRHGVEGKACAIIEQGRIGMILSGNSQERRQIIEEAAGIHHYRGKRRRAEGRLEAAERNLARIDDIVSEVKRQHNSLKRQAAKAERFRRLKESQRAVGRLLFCRQYRDRKDRQQALATDLTAAERDLAAAMGALGKAESELEELRSTRAASEASLAEWREELHETQIRMERQEGEGRRLLTERESLEARVVARERDLAEQAGALDADREAVAGLAALLEERTDEVAGAEARKAEARRITKEQLDRIQSNAGRLERHKDEVFAAESNLARIRNERQRLTELRERGSALRKRHREALDEMAAERETKLGSARSTDQQRRDLVTELTAAASRESSLSEALQEAEEKRDALASQLNERIAARDAALHRLRSLREVDERRLGYGEGVRRLIEEHPEGAPYTLVADLLQVEEKDELAVESCIGDLLQFVVVEKNRTAADLAAALDNKDDPPGRVGFLPLEGATKREAAPRDGRTWLADLVTANGDPAVATRIRAHLPAVAVVHSLDEAFALRDRYPGGPVTTTRGEFITAEGAIIVGRSQGTGLLGSKREMRELEAKVEELQAEVSRVEAALESARKACEGFKTDLNGCKARREGLERSLFLATQESDQLTAEITALARRISLLEAECADVTREIESYRQTEGEQEEAERQQLAVIEETRRRGEAMRSEIESLRSDLPALQQAEETASIALAESMERRATAEAELRSAETRLREAGERRESDLLAIGEMKARIEATAGELSEGGEQLRRLAEKAAALRNRINLEAEAVKESDEQDHSLTGDVAELRQGLETARAAHAELQVEIARVESDLAHLASRCRESLNVDVADLEEPAEPLGEAESEEALERELAELNDKVSSLGAVNLMAIDESQELEERHEFLVTQRQDILKSIEDIRKTIRRINQDSRERFQEAFADISRNFQVSFRELFGGGEAELRLQEHEDILEAGVEVIARPPGKRLQNIRLLSGGEKALTALALLFAVFQHQPAPFCILDEVDAPLDDANVLRFTQLLNSLQDKTQFILITHNQSTMTIAEELYGISMEEPGVSQVFSLKLGKAEPGNGKRKQPRIAQAMNARQNSN